MVRQDSPEQSRMAHHERLNLNQSRLEMKAVFSKKPIVKRKFQYNIE